MTLRGCGPEDLLLLLFPPLLLPLPLLPLLQLPLPQPLLLLLLRVARLILDSCLEYYVTRALTSHLHLFAPAKLVHLRKISQLS
ncbi:unnamed protein product [Toxocara canis]|uniref:Secreted protein n=1 Tax=Toxocara canis TaxID=6265 RepID=A0A183UNE5_TOXCA|nr:unnamed protein product [Toxocara canis]